jgi:hypothetical protein
MSRAPYVPFAPGGPNPPMAGYVRVPPPAPGGGWAPAPPSYPPAGPRIGFTAPTIIYDKMRDVDGSAKELDQLGHTYVDRNQQSGAMWLGAFESWMARWQPFFQKYQSDWNKLGAAFYSDDLDRQVEAFRSELLGLRSQYQTLRQANNQPVPQPSTPAPLPGTEPSGPGPGSWSLPWWVWIAVGLGAAGGAWWLYRRYEEAQRTKRTLYREVLPSLIGPNLAKAAEHDPAPASRFLIAQSDMPTLADHARVGESRAAEERALLYRPYTHPHLVPARRAPRRDYGADRYYARLERERDPFHERRERSRRDPYEEPHEEGDEYELEEDY